MSASNFSQWFWKFGYLLLIPAVILLFWLSNSDERENQNNVNPEVFEVFKEIEQNCRAEPFNEQSDKCTQVFKYQQDCKQLSSSCNSKTFYDRLKGLGYTLPNYYKENYSPK